MTTTVGSAFQTKKEIARGEQHEYDVIVPKGATTLRARVSEVTDAGADLDVYLLDCTAETKPAPPQKEKEKGNKAPPAAPPSCTPRAKAATVDRDGVVEVIDPAPGRWVVVVDAYAVPSGRTQYAYVDVYTHPKLGTVAVADTPESRAPGATWTTNAHAWVASTTDSPRTLVGSVVVTSKAIKAANGSLVRLGAADVVLTPRPQSTAAAAGGAR